MSTGSLAREASPKCLDDGESRFATADTLRAWRYVAATAVVLVLVGVTRTTIGGPGTPRQSVIGLLSQFGYLGGIVTSASTEPSLLAR